MKTYRIIHIASNIAAFGVLGIFLVYFLISYDALPERIGVHFSPVNGEFDVYAAKVFGFYPFVAGFALMLLFSIFTPAVKKIKKTGLDLTEEGIAVFRCAAVLILDLMKLTWAVFFSYWTHCVVHQISMGDGSFLGIFRIFFFILLISAPILFSRIQKRYRTVQCEEPAAVSQQEIPGFPLVFRAGHIAVNLLCFGMLLVFGVIFLFSYNALPECIGVHFGQDGGFDVYAAKIYGVYPFAAGFGLLIIFSLLTLAAKKVRSIGLRVDAIGNMRIRQVIIETLDVLKLIWSVYFTMWAYCVINQVSINTDIIGVLIILFLALFPAAAAVIFVLSQKHRSVQKNDEKETEE